MMYHFRCLFSKGIIASVKSMLHILLIAVVVSAAYRFAQFFGIPISYAGVFSADGIIQEVLGKLPAIGSIVEKGLTLIGANMSVSTNFGITVYSELAYAVILIGAYWIMSGIESVLERVFLQFTDFDGFWAFCNKMFGRLCSIVGAVLLSKVIMHFVQKLFVLTGERLGGLALLVILIIIIYLHLKIANGGGFYKTALNTAYSLVTGLIVICLIYILMLFFSLLRDMRYATQTEGIALSIGAVVTLAVLVPMSANWLAKNL